MGVQSRTGLHVGSVIITARSIAPDNQKNRREINYPVSCKATGFFMFMIWMNAAVLGIAVLIFIGTISLGKGKK